MVSEVRSPVQEHTRQFVIAWGQKQGILIYEGSLWTGYGPLLRDYVHFLTAKLSFHRQHPEFNGELYQVLGQQSLLTLC